MNSPILEIVTRHHPGRPNMLARCKKSVEPLIQNGAIHTILIDPTNGSGGIQMANRMLSLHEPKGEWVWILDDDDLHVDCDLVRYLKNTGPETMVVIMLADYTEHGVGIVPNKGWNSIPRLGDIGMSNFAVRDVVYREFKVNFDVPKCADYSFISEVLECLESDEVDWYDEIVARDTFLGNGQPE